METIHPICCGLGVHQASETACLRCVKSEDTVSVETRFYCFSCSPLKKYHTYPLSHTEYISTDIFLDFCDR